MVEIPPAARHPPTHSTGQRSQIEVLAGSLYNRESFIVIIVMQARKYVDPVLVGLFFPPMGVALI